ncbi:IclR family transcriptional regulator [Arthrobacter bambusae]
MTIMTPAEPRAERRAEPRTTISDTPANGDSKGASVLENAIAVLRSFTAEEPLLGVTEIAGRIGLHKSTVSRILATFEQEHLVERDPESRRFRLGLGMIALAGPLLAELEERRVAYPVLRELSERTGETSALMVWNGSESMCVEQIASRHQVKHLAPLGARYNEALSSSVQVFLAAEDADRVRKLLRSGSITLPGLDEEALEAYLLRLQESVTRGWAFNFGETSIEEVGVASPVFDHRGDIVASVLIPAPKFRVSQDTLASLGEACQDAARKITTRLGGRAPL